jgi:hypothetical protein
MTWTKIVRCNPGSLGLLMAESILQQMQKASTARTSTVWHLGQMQ